LLFYIIIAVIYGTNKYYLGSAPGAACKKVDSVCPCSTKSTFNSRNLFHIFF
jgi:hypothetical protein